MYPTTKIDLIDESYIPRLPQSTDDRPLFMCAFTSDKGEEATKIVDSSFIKRYGEISFYRHGQALLQADRIIASGGKILARRIVAEDSKLANTVIIAKIKSTTIPKKDAQGRPLYIDKDTGQETTETTSSSTSQANDPINLRAMQIKYEAVSVENAKGPGEVDAKVATMVHHDSPNSEGYNVYPLFSIKDNGRGVSHKKFRIYPDYEGSKTTNFLRYKIDVIDKNELLESIMFGFDPEKVYFNKGFSLDATVNNNSIQIKSKQYTEYIKQFVDKLNTNIDLPQGVHSIVDEDVFFGNLKSSKKIETIIIEDTSVNLSNPFGIPLENGSNGNFGDRPIISSELQNEMAKFFNGEMDDMIYDHVLYPIEAIIDANYPEKVKRAIESFVTFREDIVFFGDMGFVYSIDEMQMLMHISAKNKFCTYSHISYDTIDPYTKKQIRVTGGYHLARILPNHFKAGRNRPVAGILNEVIINEAIEGTVNYIPKVTPKVNQKQVLDDMRVCYAAYINNRLVIETQYTSQEPHTQLSYVNNMLALQEVMRAIRNKCPITRYSFIDGEDLEMYKSDVVAVINKYASNFKLIEFEYVHDDIMVQNKIFYAAIKVAFRDYVQAEWFKIYAINAPTGSTSIKY